MKEKQMLQTNLNKCLDIKGIINERLKPSKVHEKTSIGTYNTLAVPTLLHISENLTRKNETNPESQQRQNRGCLTIQEIKIF
jgi:hypothetical protein